MIKIVALNDDTIHVHSTSYVDLSHIIRSRIDVGTYMYMYLLFLMYYLKYLVLVFRKRTSSSIAIHFYLKSQIFTSSSRHWFFTMRRVNTYIYMYMLYQSTGNNKLLLFKTLCVCANESPKVNPASRRFQLTASTNNRKSKGLFFSF